MNARRFATLTLAVVLAAVPAGTSAAASAQTTAAGADPLYKLDAITRRQVEALRDSANELGLPGRQLVLKALEGNAKKVDSKAILGAVRQLSTNLRIAQKTLGTLDEGELMAAATALNYKVAPDDLVQFKSYSRGRSSVTALTALAGLIDRGVARDEAVTTFLGLWKQGSIDDDFQGLLRRIDLDIHSGITPGAALLQRARELPTRPPRPPEEDPETP